MENGVDRVGVFLGFEIEKMNWFYHKVYKAHIAHKEFYELKLYELYALYATLWFK